MEEAHGNLDLLGVAWRLGATLFFVLLNGFFVAAEFALVRVRASRIEDLAEEGVKAASHVQHLLTHLDRYLSACQLGITLASLVLGALGEPAVSVLIVEGARLVGIEVQPGTWLSFVSIGLAFAVITTLHMTIGEQAPKMFALRKAEETSLRTASVLRAFTFVFGPFIGALNSLSNGLLRLLGLPSGEHDSTHSAEEIRSILSLSARAGQISDREYELTRNVFRMIDLEVRHIVVPRVDVEVLSLRETTDENLRRIRETDHSRLPLCDGGLDDTVGFVHVKDVLTQLLQGSVDDLRPLARRAVYVPDTMAVSDLLLELQRKLEHCAVVVDEHGTAIGLAFREDALEEIVGPLGDEFDERDLDAARVAPGVFELSGRMPLPEVCDRLKFTIPPEEQEEEETLGGHVTARLGRLAKKGDSVDIGPYRATVLELARRRIQRIRLQLATAPVHEGSSDSPEQPAPEE